MPIVGFPLGLAEERCSGGPMGADQRDQLLRVEGVGALIDSMSDDFPLEMVDARRA
jgi:hypothetical protein